MPYWRPLHNRWLLCGLGLLILSSCGATSVLLGRQPTSQQRLQAQQLWLARPFSDYRMVVRFEYAGYVCSQELESRGEKLHRVIHNSCRPTWLGLATVERLFEIGERLDRPQPCYSLSHVCTCARVRQGDVAYDARLGYPTLIAYRREIGPNLLNADYWRRVLLSKQLPSCSTINRNVRVAVVALTPIQ